MRAKKSAFFIWKKNLYKDTPAGVNAPPGFMSLVARSLLGIFFLRG